MGLLVVRFLDDGETRWGCCEATISTSFEPDRPPDVFLYPDRVGQEPPHDGVWLSDVLLIWRPTWRRMG